MNNIIHQDLPIGKYHLYFIQQEKLSKEFQNMTWENIDLQEQNLKAFHFLGSSTIGKDDPLSMVLKQSNHNYYSFQSMNEVNNFIQQLKTEPASNSQLEMLKHSYVIFQVPQIPPHHLLQRISGTNSGLAFMIIGSSMSQLINAFLQKYSMYSKNETLLDWGCGCGRLANQLTLQKNIDYTGCDIDKEAVDWCTSNLDGTFYVTELNPPLPFDTNTFTSVVGLSVMTHLTEQHQQIWLKEMHRVLKKDGLLLLSVHGKPASIRDGLEGNLNENGFFDAIIDNALGNIVPNNYYRATFQTKEYTYKNWTKYFDIIEYNEQAIFNHQDLVVLRKK